MIKLIKSLIWILNHPTNHGKFFTTIARIIWWKVNQIFFKLPSIVDIKNGVKYIAYPDSSFGGLVVYTKLPEYYEMQYFYNLISNNDIVVDVGAHMGDYTVLAGSKIKGGKVLAFEPSSTALKVLDENVSLNNMHDRVEIYPYLASNKNGKLIYTEGSFSETGHIEAHKKSVNGKEIKSLKLDDVFKKINAKTVKVVKIDVEGASLLVLQGMAEYMRKSFVENIIVEVNQDSLDYGIDPDEILKYLRSFGYKLFVFNEKGKLTKIKLYPKNKKYINVIAKH